MQSTETSFQHYTKICMLMSEMLTFWIIDNGGNIHFEEGIMVQIFEHPVLKYTIIIHFETIYFDKVESQPMA